MRKKYKYNLLARLLLSAVVCWITLLYLYQYGNAKCLTVGKGQKHNSIAQAIKNAMSRDTIFVEAGTYSEHTIVVDKPLHIIGLQKPVIDAQYKPVEVFIIASDSVHLRGFHIRNMKHSYVKDIAAIKIQRVQHGSVQHNSISKGFFGIIAEYAKNYVISDNTIRGFATEEDASGNAIHCWKGENITIARNNVSEHRDGIYLEFVTNSFIKENDSYRNLRYGLHFMFSHKNSYKNNRFSRNGTGVAVMFSKNIIMQENLFEHSWGGAAYGLLLKEISDGEISRNIFLHNTAGVYAEGANRLHIEKNTFRSNGKALDIKGNCLDNTIAYNDFIQNTFELVTNTRYNQNVYRNNYWSHYDGYDLNRDGFGDIPYRPVNFFSSITAEITAANILLNSAFIEMLILTEKIIPTLTPKELIDSSPKIKPYHYD